MFKNSVSQVEYFMKMKDLEINAGKEPQSLLQIREGWERYRRAEQRGIHSAWPGMRGGKARGKFIWAETRWVRRKEGGINSDSRSLA